MKNILVSIDFSDVAQQVALCTAELAKFAQARLILFYAYNPILNAAPDDEESIHSEQWAQTNMDKLARKIYRKTKVSVTRLVKPGILHEVTYEVADQIKADVVVLCHKDADNGISRFSDTSIVHQLQIPTLTVPSLTNPRDIVPALAEMFNIAGQSPQPVTEAS